MKPTKKDRKKFDLDLDEYSSANDIPTISYGAHTPFSEMGPSGLRMRTEHDYYEVDENGEETIITKEQLDDAIKKHHNHKKQSEDNSENDLSKNESLISGLLYRKAWMGIGFRVLKDYSDSTINLIDIITHEINKQK